MPISGPPHAIPNSSGGTAPIPTPPPAQPTPPPSGTVTTVVWPQPNQPNGSPYPRLDVRGYANGSYTNVAVTAPIPNLLVLSAGPNDGWGNYVTAWDPRSNSVLTFAHLSQILVRPGDSLGAGQQIGIQGSTGNAWGVSGVMGAPDATHLDFGIFTGGTLVNGKYVGGSYTNPQQFLSKLGLTIGALFGASTSPGFGNTQGNPPPSGSGQGSSVGQITVPVGPGQGSAGQPGTQPVDLFSLLGISPAQLGQQFAQGVYTGVQQSFKTSFFNVASGGVLKLNDLSWAIAGAIFIAFGVFVLVISNEKTVRNVTEFANKTKKTIEKVAEVAATKGAVA